MAKKGVKSEAAKEIRKNPFIIILILILTGAIHFFLGVSFDLHFLERLTMSLLALALFFIAYQRSLYVFWVVSLTSVTIFLSLGVSFGEAYAGDSPISLPLALSPRLMYILSLAFSLLALYAYEKSKSKEKFAFILLLVFLLNWLILSTNVLYFHDWILENLLTVPFVLLVFLTHKWFRLSNISYGLIFVYLFTHIVGTHYTYAEVPFGFWLQSFLDLSRNHYDRVVHFLFGFLLAYPMREVVKRIGAARGFWGIYLPIEFVLAFSAIYEILEWLVALIFGGDLGVAYLGTQGDEWDAIKDMALAGLGSVITMLVTFTIILSYNAKEFWVEFKDSIHVKDKNPLGEQALQRWAARKEVKK